LTKKLGLDAAYEALDGRLGCGDDTIGKAEKILFACEEYVRAEDALPGDEFDSEDYLLSKAVDALVKQRDEAREWVRKMVRETQELRCAFCGETYPPGTPGHNDDALAQHVLLCQKHPMRRLRDRAERASDLLHRGHVREGLTLLDEALADLGGTDPEKPTVQP
jgi:hypothetical protein